MKGKVSQSLSLPLSFCSPFSCLHFLLLSDIPDPSDLRHVLTVQDGED